mmetsp:Transcript_2497/g.9414  ORF Transcript_2497/g.9414 Transcript_2497/m.9414 type:complete len:139 (+) Transcript_2497:1583-1999(+)
MSLSRYNNNDLFVTDFLRDPFFGAPPNHFLPSTDVRETALSFHIESNVPSFKKDDVSVDVDESGQYITIHGKHKERERDDGSRFHRVERRFSDFSRTFRIPEGCDTSKVKARMENGVLTVDIPKHEQLTSPKRSISIE